MNCGCSNNSFGGNGCGCNGYNPVTESVYEEKGCISDNVGAFGGGNNCIILMFIIAVILIFYR